MKDMAEHHKNNGDGKKRRGAHRNFGKAQNGNLSFIMKIIEYREIAPSTAQYAVILALFPAKIKN